MRAFEFLTEYTVKGTRNIKYRDGGKPPWYDQAIKMFKAGESFRGIAKKLKVTQHNKITNWLIKGKKWKSGELVNPDAPFEPGRIGRQINPQVIADVENLLKDPKLSNYDIVDLLINTYGGNTASQVRGMLPVLRQKQNPGTQTIDKTRTGAMKDPDITGFITEVDDQFEAPVGDCFEAAYKKLYDVFRDHPEAKLVHAIVTGQGDIKGVQHGHAWVEIGNTVLDFSNGRSIEMPKQIYYAIGNVDPSNSDEYKTYDFKEMADISMDQGTYGPWELPEGSL